MLFFVLLQLVIARVANRRSVIRRVANRRSVVARVANRRSCFLQVSFVSMVATYLSGMLLMRRWPRLEDVSCVLLFYISKATSVFPLVSPVIIPVSFYSEGYILGSKCFVELMCVVYFGQIGQTDTNVLSAAASELRGSSLHPD